MSEPKKQTILIVDDSEEVINLHQEVLRRAGYEVIVARNGTEAIAKAEGDQPDLIFLDVVMPHLSGIITCQFLKNSELTKHIPIVILTGLDLESGKKNAEEAGADGYLNKPLSTKQLIDTAKSLLG